MLAGEDHSADDDALLKSAAPDASLLFFSLRLYRSSRLTGRLFFPECFSFLLFASQLVDFYRFLAAVISTLLV